MRKRFGLCIGTLETGCRVGMGQRHPPERVLLQRATPRMRFDADGHLGMEQPEFTAVILDHTAGASHCVSATAWCVASCFSFVAFDFPGSKIFIML